jgi:transcriptional regulator with XRE-family HTH domain
MNAGDRRVNGAERPGPHPLLAELRRLRLEGGQKIGSIARRLGAGASTVNSWELGDRSPRIEAVAAYAEEIGFELVLRRKPCEPDPVTAEQAARNCAVLAAEVKAYDDAHQGQSKESTTKEMA